MELSPQYPRSNDSGFTLIELMAVLVILAILLMIAVPTFIGVASRNTHKHINAQVCGISGNQVLLPVSVGGTFTYDSASKLTSMGYYSFVVDSEINPQSIISFKNMPAGAHGQKC